MSKITPEVREKYESTPKQDTFSKVFETFKDIGTLGAFEQSQEPEVVKARSGERLDADKKRR